MKNITTTNDVRAAIAAGFTTKQAKKDATAMLTRAWGPISLAIRETGVSHWDLPMYAHQVGAKVEKMVSGELLARVQDLRATCADLKATEVTKVSKRIDDTKMREMTAQEATTAGIDYIDMKGDRRGYCYCCGRIGFKLDKHGELSRHGYQRPGWGYDIGGCWGSKKTPERTLDAAIEWNGEQITKLTELLTTDLFAFAIAQMRGSDNGCYGWKRPGKASALRAMRNGLEPEGTGGPKEWRRTLGRELTHHMDALTALGEVKRGI